MLNNSPYFDDVIFTESEYELEFPTERYLGAWHSTNDIQAQAGEEKWKEIIAMLKAETDGKKTISIPYKTRAWTAFVKK